MTENLAKCICGDSSLIESKEYVECLSCGYIRKSNKAYAHKVVDVISENISDLETRRCFRRCQQRYNDACNTREYVSREQWKCCVVTLWPDDLPSNFNDLSYEDQQWILALQENHDDGSIRPMGPKRATKRLKLVNPKTDNTLCNKCPQRQSCQYEVADRCPRLRAEFRKPGIAGKDFQLRNKRHNQRKKGVGGGEPTGNPAQVILLSDMDRIMLGEDGIGRVIPDYEDYE